MKKRITIAIDGPAGAGKSTTARRVARSLGYTYIDTGAMYRAVTLAAIRTKKAITADVLHDLIDVIDLQLAATQDGQRTILNGVDVSEEIRNPDVTDKVSEVSAYHDVRERMVNLQRVLGRDGGVVMDGRDIGTVVFPDAEIKVFLIADVEERIRRRAEEMAARGIATTPDDVRRQIVERDRLDSTRIEGPLVKAVGAHEVDTTSMSIDQQVETILDLVEKYQLTYNMISLYGGI